MVLVGVVGEIWVPRVKFKPCPVKRTEDSDENSPMIAQWETERTAWEARMKKWGHRWENTLILGLALELVAMPFHFKEAGDLAHKAEVASERAASTESNNLVLRSNVVILESAVQWRTIAPEQKSILVAVLKPLVQANVIRKSTVSVIVEQTDFEARWYAKRIVEALAECGFELELQSGIGFDEPGAPILTGLGILAEGPKLPLSMLTVKAALEKAKIPLTIAHINTNAPQSDSLKIFVWHKPEK
jgi:hypothetical protein